MRGLQGYPDLLNRNQELIDRIDGLDGSEDAQVAESEVGSEESATDDLSSVRAELVEAAGEMRKMQVVGWLVVACMLVAMPFFVLHCIRHVLMTHLRRSVDRAMHRLLAIATKDEARQLVSHEAAVMDEETLSVFVSTALRLAEQYRVGTESWLIPFDKAESA